MSPRVTATISANDWRSTLDPQDALLVALLTVMQRKLPIGTGEVGVQWSGMSWSLDRRLSPRGASLIGTLLLDTQFEPLDDEDPHGTAARALDIGLAWVEGAADGWSDETASGYWTGGNSRHLYLDGWKAGAYVRRRYQRLIGR